VVVTDHQTFDYETMVADADLIVDTRNAIHKAAAHVFKLGAPHPPGVMERVVAG
jgi:UDP-N-acetyl-D-mannosaminuronate dehydrogenase